MTLGRCVFPFDVLKGPTSASFGPQIKSSFPPSCCGQESGTLSVLPKSRSVSSPGELPPLTENVFSLGRLFFLKMERSLYAMISEGVFPTHSASVFLAISIPRSRERFWGWVGVGGGGSHRPWDALFFFFLKKCREFFLLTVSSRQRLLRRFFVLLRSADFFSRNKFAPLLLPSAAHWYACLSDFCPTEDLPPFSCRGAGRTSFFLELFGIAKEAPENGLVAKVAQRACSLFLRAAKCHRLASPPQGTKSLLADSARRKQFPFLSFASRVSAASIPLLPDTNATTFPHCSYVQYSKARGRTLRCER